MGSKDATWKRQNAAESRVLAKRVNGPARVARLEDANKLEEEADALLKVPSSLADPMMVGPGGEIAASTLASGPFVDTLRGRPDMVAVDASRQRLTLAGQAGGLALALDAAETVRAENSLEKMLAHQMAAAHTAAVELQAEARALLREFAATGRSYVHLSAEAGRLMNASARMMDTFQHGMLTLHRLRTAGRQTLVVQHVHVNQGGQAVVAGKMGAGRRRKGSSQGD